MSPDEKPPTAEKEAPVEQASGQDAPITKEEAAAQFRQLAEHAKAAGLTPIQTMARTYASQGMELRDAVLSAVGRFLAGLEDADNSKKKKD